MGTEITLSEMAHLSVLYAQKHRYYHDITHINDCLVELEEVCKVDLLAAQGRSLIEKAIWYHDAVYNPLSKDNEYNSMNLLSDDDEVVRSIIMMTAYHTETQSFNGFRTENYAYWAKIMLDIDLAGMGKSWDVYSRNGENIRKEYAGVPDHQYDLGRYQFLETINERESLYYTEYFYNKYHEQSKRNIALNMKQIEEMSGDPVQVYISTSRK